MSINNMPKRKFIAYPEAMAILRDRLGATLGELAVWVSFGNAPGCGGIAAYREATITDEPQELEFDFCSPEAFDYIGPLMGAWFIADNIDSFEPSNRYLEYPRLVERWNHADSLEDVHAYIQAKVREARLDEIHPVTRTQPA